MNINIKTDRDFGLWLDHLKTKYGEDFEILNGFHDSQLNFSDFIDGFIDKNMADVTIDSNANAHTKDVRSLLAEQTKSHNKLFCFNKIFYEIKKKFGLQTAREWLEDEYSGALYLHNAPSSSTMGYCYAFDLTRLAKEGMFFLQDYNYQPPKHLTTFLDYVVEFVSFFSNRSSGAVGLPNLLIWTWYFWKKDVENGYAAKDPEYYLKQCFQKIIYRLNQNFLRIDQSAFTNVSIYDRKYLEGVFGGMEFPDGEFAIDHIEDLIEHQKIFMDVVAEIRRCNLFTFPVISTMLMYKDGVFQDEEFAKWACRRNMEWNDSNFFVSSDIGILSNCCFSGNQPVLAKSSDGVIFMPIRDMHNMPSKLKRNLTVFHNGSWVEAKTIKVPAKKMYKVTTVNNKTILVTEDHLNVTQRGDIPTANLTTDDYLMFSARALESVYGSDIGLTYEDGFLIGMYAGDGSTYWPESPNVTPTVTPTVTLSLNAEKYQIAEPIISKSLDKFGASMHLGTIYNNVYPITIRNIDIANFIRSFISGNYCFEKAINMNCLLQSKEFRQGILDGYYLTDGGNSNRIYTTSPYMVDCLEALITSLGLQSIIDISDRTGDGMVVIRGQEFNRNYPVYCIRWYGMHNKRKFINNYMVINNSVFFKIDAIEPYDDPDPYAYCFEIANQMEPYFTLPNGIISHNCRLISDTRKLKSFINSIGGTALSVGSIQVITINLMRIAFESGGDKEKYIDILRKRTQLVIKALWAIRHIIQRNIEKGLLPNYCDGGVEMDKQFSTCGVNALHEAIEKMGMTEDDQFGNNFYTKEGLDFANRIFDTINEVKDAFECDYSHNVEQCPCERAAVIFASKDKLLYDHDSEKFIYSNQWYPLWKKTTLQSKLEVSAILDKQCNGGSVVHINLQSEFPSFEVAWDTLNSIARSGVYYFAYNSRINECANHHGFVGSDTCPECGGKVIDTWQRVVGFLTPTRSYSKERKREFNARYWYSIANEKLDF